MLSWIGFTLGVSCGDAMLIISGIDEKAKIPEKPAISRVLEDLDKPDGKPE